MLRDQILIVEDDAILRENLAEILRSEDFEVLTASDASAAQSIASEVLPDLIISDVMMPGMDGFQLASLLAQEPHTALIPIIFLTAKASKEDFRTGLDLGAEDYLPKPCPADKLLSVVRMRLARRRSLEKQLVREWWSMGPANAAIPNELAIPLRQIFGFAGVLTQHHEGLDAREIGRVAQDILQASCRLSRKLIQVRIRERLEAGLSDVFTGAAAESPTCDAVSTLKKVVGVCNVAWVRAEDLTISAQPGTLGSRSSLLEPVLVELLTNAFQYSRRGTPVQLTGEVIPEGYRISVRDQGPGLTPARMAEMQRPLDAVNPTSGVFGGLMVVRQLLHSAGIALNIESQALVGTTMSFVIPPAHV